MQDSLIVKKYQKKNVIALSKISPIYEIFIDEKCRSLASLLMNKC